MFSLTIALPVGRRQAHVVLQPPEKCGIPGRIRSGRPERGGGKPAGGKPAGGIANRIIRSLSREIASK